ncbi:MAG: hypothetical protein ACOC2F_06525 [Bacteroidota bacterium]
MQNIIFFVFMLMNLPVHGQNSCRSAGKGLPPGYISDGQYHEFLVKGNTPVKIHTTFLRDIHYGLHVCPSSDFLYSIILMDKNQEHIFSQEGIKGNFNWNYIFSSTIECVIEIQLEQNIAKKIKFNLEIGYKPN